MYAENIAAVGYALAAGLFFALTALLLSRWRNRSQSQVLAIATFSSTVWAGALAAQSSGLLTVAFLATLLEWLRNICWVIALTMVLRGLDDSRRTERVAIRYALLLPAVGVVLFALYRSRSLDALSDVLLVVGGLVLSAVLLVLAEQIYRNSPADSRSTTHWSSVSSRPTLRCLWSTMER